MGDSFARNSLAPGVFRVSSSSFPRFTLAPVRSFPRGIVFLWRFPAAFSWRKRHRDDSRAGDNGCRAMEGDQGSSPPGDCAPSSFCVLQSRSLLIADGVLPRAPLPQDPSSHDEHLSAPVTSLTVCSLSLSLSAHSFSRSRPLTLSRSSRGDTRSAPAVHRYALGSGGSRV